MHVAREILNQLGGNQFFVLCGVKNVVFEKDGVSFQIGKNNSKVNYVRITLNGKDLYDMTFCRRWGINTQIIKEDKDVYVEQLRSIFTENTGMYTSLYA